MQFNSYSYLLCLVWAVSVFWGLPPSARRWYVMAVSAGFYATWSPLFVLVPVAMCSGVYLCARIMILEPQRARLWFWAGISYVLAMLIVFRFHMQLAAAADALSAVLARDLSTVQLLKIAVPLGISFYSFEAISFLIDVRQGRVQKPRITDLFLFIMFWPHLIAGPIVRFRELVPQFAFARSFDLDVFLSGLDRLIWGLVQKNLLADNLGRWVDEGFLAHASANNTFLDNWFLALAFALQIYFDFAAYSNMAIGAARLIGVNLPENFRFPYLAKNPSDFWSRWHMTLSRWIRDYLFFPMNVRYQGRPLPLYLSLLGIMALVGVWHGAGWGFILWGVMHGAYLVLWRVWERVQSRAPHMKDALAVTFGAQLFTLFAVIIAWIPFRAATLLQAKMMLATMLLHPSFRISYALNQYLATMLAAMVCLLEPLTFIGLEKLNRAMSKGWWRGVDYFALRPGLYACGLLMFVLFDERSTQFIYFQF
jgi:alginate O-acetyltransferase complex protein AlgI